MSPTPISDGPTTWEHATARSCGPVAADADVDAASVWLARELQPALVGALTLYCGDPWVAEELAAETIVRALERWPQVSRHPNPAAWAHRVGLNLASSWYRRRAAERRANRRHGTGREDAADPDVADRVAVRRALVALPAKQRAALVLRFYAGMTCEEAAVVLRCAPGTVRSLSSRALAALRGRGLRLEIDTEGAPDARA